MAFTVTYNSNGATGGSVPVDRRNYASGAQVTVLGNTGSLTEAGGTFASWNTAADGSGTVYGGGAQFNITTNVTLYAQWYITAGLTGGGVTTHYAFAYDSALAKTAANFSGPEPARTNALIAAAENDFNLMSGWFGGIPLSGYNLPISVSIASGPQRGANWGVVGTNTGMTILAGLGDSIYCRYLFVAEVTEIFMSSQHQGWYAPDGSNEQSCGEGLSRFLSAQFLKLNGIDAIPPGFLVSEFWLNSGARADYVNNTVEHDHLPDAASGCATLFIYYLHSQLGFSINDIVGAAPGIDSSCLRGVYQKLTRDTEDPFPFFKQLLDLAFPPNQVAIIPGPNQDNPFPLTALTTIPDCTGASEGLAKKILAQAGLRLGTVTSIRPAGTGPNPPFAVKSQEPLANTEVLLDTAVNLILQPHLFHDPHPRAVPPPSRREPL